MTERLYYHDAYLREFPATVVDAGADGRRVVLDRTALYPTSGGQPHDTGSLGGRRVVDVVDEGERIVHVLDAPLEAVAVEGRVDWPRRYDHMQQHTGQHLLSALLEERLGAATASVHFGAQVSTVELELAALDPAALAAIEWEANALAREARPVTVTFEAAATATGLRRPPPREGTIRVVTIAGLDRSACGGTHVRSTAEVLPVLLDGVERVRGRVRVAFRCGDRALARARRDHDALAALAGAFSAAPDDVPALVERQAAQLRELEGTVRRLAGEVVAARARDLVGATTAVAGLRRIHLVVPGGEAESLRLVAQACAREGRVLFAGGIAGTPTVVLAASADAGVDAARRLQAVLARVGGKGGGTAQLAQGRVADPARVDAVLQELLADG